jgi:hypothetical protein
MQEIIHVQRLQMLQCRGVPVNVVCVHNTVVVQSIELKHTIQFSMDINMSFN